MVLRLGQKLHFHVEDVQKTVVLALHEEDELQKAIKKTSWLFTESWI